jgi:membrane peptidoglycan carboxypeptidase
MAYEQEHSKQEILEDYLNIAFFGDGAYGIKIAARHYFSVAPSNLSLAQAALLAGLVQNPTRFNPTQYGDLARNRRDVVLQRMADLGVVSRKQMRRAKQRPLGLDVTNFSNGCVTSPTPFFCDYVYNYLLTNRELGETRRQRENTVRTGGLTIHTTVDQRFQRVADAAVKGAGQPHRSGHRGDSRWLCPGNGEVRALAQSRPMGNKVKEGETFLNYVVPERYGDANGFQGGSTFKVFTLGSALKQGIPLSTSFPSPSPYYVPAGTLRNCAGDPTGSWQLSNSTGVPGQTYNMYTGTQQSINSFFAQLEVATGLCPPIKLARSMGVDIPETQEVPSFTLGVSDVSPVTMAGAYATFAARGVLLPAAPGAQDPRRPGTQGRQRDPRM